MPDRTNETGCAVVEEICHEPELAARERIDRSKRATWRGSRTRSARNRPALLCAHSAAHGGRRGRRNRGRLDCHAPRARRRQSHAIREEPARKRRHAEFICVGQCVRFGHPLSLVAPAQPPGIPPARPSGWLEDDLGRLCRLGEHSDRSRDGSRERSAARRYAVRGTLAQGRGTRWVEPGPGSRTGECRFSFHRRWTFGSGVCHGSVPRARDRARSHSDLSLRARVLRFVVDAFRRFIPVEASLPWIGWSSPPASIRQAFSRWRTSDSS